jgi:hypothetical protein
MKKQARCLFFSVLFLITPFAFADDSTQSSDSGVLVSSSGHIGFSDHENTTDNGGNSDLTSSDQASANQQPSSNSNESPTSSTDPIIIKSVDAQMFQITANMKLTQDQIDAIRPIVEEYIVRLRDLQLSLEKGTIDSKTMYNQRLQFLNDETQKLGAIISQDQMKVWMNMQDN